MRPEDSDKVERLLDLWRKERPELDYVAPSVVIRLHRASEQIGVEVDRFFERRGLSRGDFEVLAALRRIGRPYELPQHDIMRLAGKTSGTMTFRINRLVDQGLVQRRPDPHDARAQNVSLTHKGVRLCDELLPDHLKNEADLLSGLDRRSQAQLARLLRRLLSSLERERATGTRRRASAAHSPDVRARRNT